MWFGPLWMILWLAVLVALIVAIVRWLGATGDGERPRGAARATFSMSAMRAARLIATST